jgi:protein-export membrane protein SecD
MQKLPAWKIAFYLCCCLFFVIAALPNFLTADQRASLPDWLPQRTMNLGLDLRGGSHLQLKVGVDTYLNEQLQGVMDEVRRVMQKYREDGAGYRDLEIKADEVHFTGRFDGMASEKRSELMQELRASLPGFTISEENQGIHIHMNDAQEREMRRQIISQSIEIINRRINASGTLEPIIQAQGEDRILLQVPGVDDPEKLKRLLGKTAKLTFHFVETGISQEDLRSQRVPFDVRGLPADSESQPDGSPFYYGVKKRIILSGDLLVNASATFQENRPVVSFRFNPIGARKFGEITAANVGKPFAIVLDDKVISAPVINEPIPGGSGIITGNFTVETANELALLLRAGALPAPLEVVEERSVGPSLGADSIEAGSKASLLAVILVMGFMIFAYGLFGFFACLALVMNLVAIIAALSIFGATLTLPGIAGIVLTLGMAVDANVLIYERMREEARNGKTVPQAVESGFQNAFRTIFDSNITTLFGTFLLFYFGSGTIRGFAVTLSIGILASMFTAITLSRLMILWYVHAKRPRILPV